MGKIAQWYQGGAGFLGEVKVELLKCAWPTRQELIDSTIVVIISVILLGAYVSLSDVVATGFLNFVIR